MFLFFNGSFAEDAFFFLHMVSLSPNCFRSVCFALLYIRGLPQMPGVLAVCA